MATEPTVMKMRLAEINRFVQDINLKTTKDMPAWEVHIMAGQASVVEGIRGIMGRLPKGYTRSEPSLKTQAKKRFLQWRENQAMAEWKKLSDEERAVWEGYVTDGLEFGTIREKELGRETDGIKKGDRVEIVRDIWFLGNHYRPGLLGEVNSLNFFDGTDVVTSYALTFSGTGLPPVNAYPHEIKRASDA